jgi:hypothetical protein
MGSRCCCGSCGDRGEIPHEYISKFYFNLIFYECFSNKIQLFRPVPVRARYVASVLLSAARVCLPCVMGRCV